MLTVFSSWYIGTGRYTALHFNKSLGRGIIPTKVKSTDNSSNLPRPIKAIWENSWSWMISGTLYHWSTMYFGTSAHTVWTVKIIYCEEFSANLAANNLLKHVKKTFFLSLALHALSIIKVFWKIVQSCRVHYSYRRFKLVVQMSTPFCYIHTYGKLFVY